MHQDRILRTAMTSTPSGAFLLLLLSSTVSGQGSVVSTHYWYIQNHYTWQEAQSFCSDYNTDLITIYTESVAENLYLKKYFAWIDVQVTSGCALASYNDINVYSAQCEEYFFFICDNPDEVITQSKTWSEAWQYCRDNNRDLASFSDHNTMKAAADEQDFPIWTGQHRDGETWRIALSHYKNWAQDEPGNNGDCVTISSVKKEMATQNCFTRLPFICYKDNLLLVKENKTWEEALEHCRALGYDLVSVQPEDYNYVMNKVMAANTEEVWTGLRFLAGEWLWVNGADMIYSDLPLCPPVVQHCGALSKNSTGSMETRDCAERRNFLCYTM